jgi:hypothetical protein
MRELIGSRHATMVSSSSRDTGTEITVAWSTITTRIRTTTAISTTATEVPHSGHVTVRPAL